MAKGSNNQGQQVQTQEPYFKKKVGQAAGDAKSLYKDGSGFNPFESKWWVGQSGATKDALKGMAKTARRGNPLGDQSMDFVSGLMGGAYNPDASGYRNLLGRTGNEYFETVADDMANKLGDDITRQIGGDGSFGSAAHTGAIADQVGAMRSRMMSDNWNQNNQMQRALLGDITGVEQMGVQNQMAGLGAAPGAWEFGLADERLLGDVGAAKEGYQAAKLEGQMNRFTAQDMADINRLGWYNSMIGGGGAGYGTTTASVSSPSNRFGSAAGGALLGGQIGGIPGAAIGGLGGLLLGQ